MSDTSKQDGRPSFQFYPNDWRGDVGLKLCSLAAKGLWIDMLCIMWVAPRRGCLTEANGKQIPAKGLAKLVGSTEAKVKRALSELEAHNVYSTLDDETIYNRRMLRVWKLSLTRAEAGRKGGLAAKGEQIPPPSSSTSTSAAPSASSPKKKTIYILSPPEQEKEEDWDGRPR